jgi:hypothetical protein
MFRHVTTRFAGLAMRRAVAPAAASRVATGAGTTGTTAEPAIVAGRRATGAVPVDEAPGAHRRWFGLFGRRALRA